MQYKAISLVLLGACALPGSMSADDDGTGSDQNNPNPTNPTASGWTAIPLVNDGNIQHADNDLVSAIYFSSADKGYVATQGAGESFSDGGAVFAIANKTASVAFSGANGGPSQLGTIDFTGLEPTPTGVVAMAYSADIVRGDASGHFAIAKDGNLAGIEPLLAYRETSAGVTLIRDTGVVSVSTQAGGPNASFTDVWAPDATEQIPASLPANECQGGPLGAGAPVLKYSAYVGNGLIAYTAAPSFDPQICVSTNGGTAFYPALLDVDDDASQNAPSGVVFSSAQNGITWWGSTTAKPYIQRTTDGGKTWTRVALPASVATHGLELNGGFFAPDGQHGWIVGYDHDTHLALALSSSDGGASWATIAGLGEAKLYSGFALDADHVWIGGDQGTLLVHD